MIFFSVVSILPTSANALPGYFAIRTVSSFVQIYNIADLSMWH